MPSSCPAEKRPVAQTCPWWWWCLQPGQRESPSREGAEGGCLPAPSHDSSPARRTLYGLAKSAWEPRAQVTLWPQPQPSPAEGSRPAVRSVFTGASGPGQAVGLASASLQFFCFFPVVHVPNLDPSHQSLRTPGERTQHLPAAEEPARGQHRNPHPGLQFCRRPPGGRRDSASLLASRSGQGGPQDTPTRGPGQGGPQDTPSRGFAGRPEDTPTRGPGAAASPRRHGCPPSASAVMSPPPPASSQPGRGSAGRSDRRCRWPGSTGASHCWPPSLGSWAQATWLAVGTRTCRVLSQVHFLPPSPQPHQVGRGKMRTKRLREAGSLAPRSPRRRESQGARGWG